MPDKKILFTGGGSAGHVTLNLSLIPAFRKNGWDIIYVGSDNGIEKELVCKLRTVKYYSIPTGKLRRYFSWANITDLVKVPFGVFQACLIICKEKPDIIFSKGGFVSFPVVIAGWLCRKTVIMHESDLTPGLANRLSLPFVTKLFTTFEATRNSLGKPFYNQNKIEHIGPVVSERLKNGKLESACKICNFDNSLPIILVFGGSLGAQSINQAIRHNLATLLKHYQIIHICGKDQIDNQTNTTGYRQFEYVENELKDFMAAAEIVISRAGSNSIFELLSLKKPMLLIPLPQTTSRGEQSLNAESFRKKGYCEIIKDEELGNDKLFMETIAHIYQNREKYKNNMSKNPVKTTDCYKLYEEISRHAFMPRNK